MAALYQTFREKLLAGKFDTIPTAALIIPGIVGLLLTMTIGSTQDDGRDRQLMGGSYYFFIILALVGAFFLIRRWRY